MAERIATAIPTAEESFNELGQRIGKPLPGWQQPACPQATPMDGHYGRLDPLVPEKHCASLFEGVRLDEEGRDWTYLSSGPFRDEAHFLDFLKNLATRDNWIPFVVSTAADGAKGIACYLRIDPPNGSIEVGGLVYTKPLKRTTAATEAMFLMMERAFDLGYRRYEWKCDTLNARSRAAAERLGFRFEGIFRNARVYNGRSRDTAWYSITDSEWPDIRNAILSWLDRSNFDTNGRQRRSLGELQLAR